MLAEGNLDWVGTLVELQKAVSGTLEEDNPVEEDNSVVRGNLVEVGNPAEEDSSVEEDNLVEEDNPVEGFVLVDTVEHNQVGIHLVEEGTLAAADTALGTLAARGNLVRTLSSSFHNFQMSFLFHQ